MTEKTKSGYGEKKLDLKQVKDLHDKAYTNNQPTRIKSADDRLFAYLTQWDGTLLEDTQLGYRGEFNIIRKATRDIMADLGSNPIQISFEPTATSRGGKEEADILNGLYLTSDRQNTSIEAKGNACQEAVDCGIGGWELRCEYESNRIGDKRQVIKRWPVYEFNNNAFPDPNAKLIDKSDAKYWSILEPYSLDGYKEIYKELTGEETEGAPENFSSPESSYVFPWITGNEVYYLVRFYHKTLVKDKVLTMTDPIGQPVKLLESSLKEVMDDMIEQGYEITDEKPIKRWQVMCYIASGEEILKSYEIAGEKIPVVPMYGERAFIEGEEHYEGVIRLAKDPQRLRNFLMSYLGDMVSRSPREKPIFGAAQVAGFRDMYEQNGADNNYPYLLQNLKDPEGNDLPHGPLGVIKPPEINQAMATLLDLSRQAVEDVANDGLSDDIADSDLSGRAIEIIQARLDQQSIVYQKNYKFAERYDADVYQSMSTVINDSPRSVTLTMPDGTRKTEELMKTVMDEDTGELVTLNDLTNMEFDVYAKIGKHYDSEQSKTRDQLTEMAEQVAETDPMLHKALIYKIIDLTNGVNMDDIKDYTRKQLMLMGIKPPETPEDEQFLQQALSQPKEPDSSMVLAQAELAKGQAAIMEQERTALKDKQEDMTKDAKVQIDAYNAETKRLEVEQKGKNAGLDIEIKRVTLQGKKIDNVHKMIAPFKASANKPRASA